MSQRILDPRRQHALKTRARVEAGIREFFLSREFIETRTPLLVRSPGMEVHIRPYKLVTGEYLPTSPEFAMKRLLVGGLERIFQICPAFRSEPVSAQHLPEFTMLEWYRAHAGFEEIMEDFENLAEFLARKIFGRPEISYRGREISLAAPWPRRRVKDLFVEHTGIDLTRAWEVSTLREELSRLEIPWSEGDSWDDLYFRVWLERIEPKLTGALFVTHYPASQAALSVLETGDDGHTWARRFEPYIAGIEIGNAFEELTDADEYRRRFTEDMNLREKIYGPAFPKSPMDEEFLAAMEEGMPPSGGIAVGVDRLVMLFADEPDIDYTVWLKPDISSPAP